MWIKDIIANNDMVVRLVWVTQNGALADVGWGEEDSRPSKCPKFYTNRILGEQNVRQKVR